MANPRLRLIVTVQEYSGNVVPWAQELAGWLVDVVARPNE